MEAVAPVPLAGPVIRKRGESETAAQVSALVQLLAVKVNSR